MPLMDGGENSIRSEILYGTFGQGICITDGKWTLFKSPVQDAPLFYYSTMITRPLIVDNPVDGRLGKRPAEPTGHARFDESVQYPMWKIPIEIDPRTYENFLFDRESDPEQRNNLWHSAADQRNRMLDLLRHRMDEDGHPPEQLVRLGL